MSASAAALGSGDPWTLTTTQLDGGYRGTYLGNGTLGQRVMQDGLGWDHGLTPVGGSVGPSGGAAAPSAASRRSEPLPAFMAGLYEQEHLVTVPSPTALVLRVGQQQYLSDPRRIRSYRQSLSLRDGVLTTEADWDTGSGNLRVESKTVIARYDPYLALVQLRLRSDRALDLTLAQSTAVGGDFGAPRAYVREVQLQNTTAQQVSVPVSDVELQTVTRHGRIQLAQVDRVLVGGSIVRAQVPTGDSLAFRTLKVGAGSEVVVSRFTATASSREASDPLVVAEESVERAAKMGAEGVFSRHRAAWARLWKSDIVIEGAPADQQAVRACLFYLRQSAREGGDASIPPMGLSSDSFGGHVFWDAETWIFPALLAFHPEMARPILEYRLRTLPQAMRNAKAEGCRGASYAWESADVGTEQAPEPFRRGRHVTADVALAVRQYYTATGDRAWLAARGWPILRATADYWASRARPSAGGDRYEIRGVTTPDENAGIVNNSAWVNFAARRNLEIAVSVAGLLKQPADPRWLRVARGLILPRDPRTGLLREHDGYTGTKIKQADTLLLLYPGGLSISQEEKERLYETYAPRAIAVGPAMTDSIHAIVAAKLGRDDDAYHRFQASYQPFLRAPFLLFSEKRTRDNLCFLTGAAGVVQAVVNGFGGVRLGDPRQSTEAALLPPAWRSLTLRGLSWHGRRYDRVVRSTGSTGTDGNSETADGRR